jgi:hypothetical protein
MPDQVNPHLEAVTAEGHVVAPRSIVYDRHGGEFVYLYATRPTEDGKSGKVVISDGPGGGTSELYAHLFGLAVRRVPEPAADGVAIHVHTQATAAGDRVSVYIGTSRDSMKLSGILWCGRAASTKIARLLDPDGATTEHTATVAPQADVTDIREPR